MGIVTSYQINLYDGILSTAEVCASTIFPNHLYFFVMVETLKTNKKNWQVYLI
jgi:hypothetical protein